MTSLNRSPNEPGIPPPPRLLSSDDRTAGAEPQTLLAAALRPFNRLPPRLREKVWTLVGIGVIVGGLLSALPEPAKTTIFTAVWTQVRSVPPVASPEPPAGRDLAGPPVDEGVPVGVTAVHDDSSVGTVAGAAIDIDGPLPASLKRGLRSWLAVKDGTRLYPVMPSANVISGMHIEAPAGVDRGVFVIVLVDDVTSAAFEGRRNNGLEQYPVDTRTLNTYVERLELGNRFSRRP
jgi:hypothetical protein